MITSLYQKSFSVFIGVRVLQNKVALVKNKCSKPVPDAKIKAM